MATWPLEFLADAEKDLAKLDRPVRKRIIEKFVWLLQNSDVMVHLPLSGEFKNFYKLRLGDWRVIYTIDWKKLEVVVSYIDRRDKVYKRP